MSDRSPPRGLRLSRFLLAGLTVTVLDYPLPDADDDLLERLTPAQRACVTLVLSGKSTKVIAAERGIAETTVAKQLGAAYRRLGVGTKHELAALLSAGRGPARPG